MTIFDPSDPVNGRYAAELVAGDPALGFRHKLVVVDEDWCNWTLPGDPRERVLVRVAPFEPAGRGSDPHAGFAVRVLGADDAEMVLDLEVPDRQEFANAMFDVITDGVTRELLAALGFVAS